MTRYVQAVEDALRSSEWAIEQAVHDYDNVYLKLFRRLSDLLDKPLVDCRVLDLGCGYSYPNVALFASAGVDVLGLDTEQVFFRDGRYAVLRERMREKGLLKALYHAGPRYGAYRTYYAALAELAGTTIHHDTLSLLSYDGNRMPLADGCCDAICSNAVLEHVVDLPTFVNEVARVLRPDGVIDMVWHNFFSPSGGHRRAEDVVESSWGHVTGESPAPCFLNRVTPDDVMDVFGSRFEILRLVGVSQDHSLQDEPGFRPEGASELTAEWRDRLPDLPSSLLTTRSYLIQGRRQDH